MPSVTMISAYAKETADPAAITAMEARQATRSEISLGTERPSMAVSAVACVVTAPDDGRGIDLFSAAQSPADRDAAVLGLRPPGTDHMRCKPVGANSTRPFAGTLTSSSACIVLTLSLMTDR